MLEGVLLTPLKRVHVTGGDVLHAMKSDDAGFHGFGEAYFSTAEFGAVKGWKRHREMTLNLVVPVGQIRFVIHDDRQNSSTCNAFYEVVLSKDNYCRLTVPPMVWLGFQGVSKETGVLLNLADIKHDPSESDKMKIEKLNYKWDINQ